MRNAGTHAPSPISRRRSAACARTSSTAAASSAVASTVSNRNGTRPCADARRVVHRLTPSIQPARGAFGRVGPSSRGVAVLALAEQRQRIDEDVQRRAELVRRQRQQASLALASRSARAQAARRSFKSRARSRPA